MNLVQIVNQVNEWLEDETLSDDEVNDLISQKAKEVNISHLQLQEVADALFEKEFDEAEVRKQIEIQLRCYGYRTSELDTLDHLKPAQIEMIKAWRS